MGSFYDFSTQFMGHIFIQFRHDLGSKTHADYAWEPAATGAQE